MRSLLPFAALALALAAAAPARAADPAPLLLIDDSVKYVLPDFAMQSFETRDARPPNGHAWEPRRPHLGETVARTVVHVLLLGPAAGAGAAGGSQLGAIIAARRAWADPLVRQVMVEDRFQRHVNDRLRTAFAREGEAIGRVVISPDAGSGVLPRAAKDETRAYVVRPRTDALIKLSANDRRIVINTWIEQFERPVAKFRARERARVAYVSRPAAGSHAIETWAADDAAAFWAELDRGLDAVVAVARSAEARPTDVAESEVVALASGGPGERFAGRLWKRVGDDAFIVQADGGVLVVHDAPELPARPTQALPAPPT